MKAQKAEIIVPAGSIVRSKSGRDSGKLMVVLGRDADGLLLLADGMTRKIDKPKRKKVIHIELTTLPTIDITEMTNKKAAAAVKNVETYTSEMPKG